MMSHIQICANPYDPKEGEEKEYQGKCYQVFGLDLLVDKHYKCWVLEINDHPSMSIYACKNGTGCDHEPAGCALSLVDIHSKVAVHQDMVEMLLAEEDGDFNSLVKVFPGDYNVMYQMLNTLRIIFLTLSGGE